MPRDKRLDNSRQNALDALQLARNATQDSAKYFERLDFRQEFNLKKLKPKERQYLKDLATSLMLLGFSETETAYMLQVPVRSVYNWRASADEQTQRQFENAALQAVGHRIASALNTSLTALERVALYTSEREYLQKQDPEKISKIFEMLTNFNMRLIESKQRADLAQKQLNFQQQQREMQAQQTADDTTDSVTDVADINNTDSTAD